jgi:hypothetical protein
MLVYEIVQKIQGRKTETHMSLMAIVTGTEKKIPKTIKGQTLMVIEA